MSSLHLYSTKPASRAIPLHLSREKRAKPSARQRSGRRRNVELTWLKKETAHRLVTRTIGHGACRISRDESDGSPMAMSKTAVS